MVHSVIRTDNLVTIENGSKEGTKTDTFLTTTAGPRSRDTARKSFNGGEDDASKKRCRAGLASAEVYFAGAGEAPRNLLISSAWLSFGLKCNALANSFLAIGRLLAF